MPEGELFLVVCLSGDLFDLLHFGHEMPQKVLDAVLQRRRR
ncbi:hypothetical protein MESS2_1050045 [Mesorhizobium metallidurans STM 2683]|uniref:Uncharacterized protein n=1 Tax=Mesorhizobium metallidurans STM 2683 TaxID=1297569 RepID=M5EUS1_9HYPH|nr:hypothetical protein MESS2_1050045 [Mesorhizobium metallidurans STM 2683]